jgi:hypothetical protein
MWQPCLMEASADEPQIGRLDVDPLDAGEYVRVRVAIDSNQWRDVEPGRYNVHALLADLGVRAETPPEHELTEELITRHRPRTGGMRAPRWDRRSLTITISRGSDPSAQLRRFRSEHLGHLLREAEELEREPASATPDGPAADDLF